MCGFPFSLDRALSSGPGGWRGLRLTPRTAQSFTTASTSAAPALLGCARRVVRAPAPTRPRARPGPKCPRYSCTRVRYAWRGPLGENGSALIGGTSGRRRFRRRWAWIAAVIRRDPRSFVSSPRRRAGRLCSVCVMVVKPSRPSVGFQRGTRVEPPRRQSTGDASKDAVANARECPVFVCRLWPIKPPSSMGARPHLRCCPERSRCQHSRLLAAGRCRRRDAEPPLLPDGIQLKRPVGAGSPADALCRLLPRDGDGGDTGCL